MALSELVIQKLAPKKERFERCDGNGLYLRVMPTGSKSWVFRYMLEGKARRFTLGTYPNLSATEARKGAATAREEVKAGIDPAAVRMQARATWKAAPSVSDLIQEFWDMELKDTPSGKERLRLMAKDVEPVWGSRKVVDITRRDAVVLLDDVRQRAAIVGNRLQGVLVRMFRFASERGIIEHSPLDGMRRPQEQARKRVLGNDEIQLLWNALDLDNQDVKIYQITKLALKMVLLTGQRPGEVCGMTWAEIDAEGFWNISAERRKGRVSQRVPLTDMALEIIEQARVYSGLSPFVFASVLKTDAPITTHSLSVAILHHWKPLGFSEQFTPHDLRRTLRTRLAELGIDDVTAERVLGHKLQGIMAVYNRHGYDAEKRQALEKWARKLRQIVGIEEPGVGKVIQLRRVVA